ncbi:aminotransferase-like domain-containing protein [Streptomyces sp. 4N509B]|uniref:aminotransferase-like domain-containing protein n=1 Tax=Streptomyces sp. 4N509B TaxID=3457413 RepID=UPI003FD3E301
MAGQLRRAIADGRLPVGSTLPATRVLAAELRVSRGVVTEAYQRLGEDGHVAGKGRRGTVVVAAPLVADPQVLDPRAAPARGRAAAGGTAAGADTSTVTSPAPALAPVAAPVAAPAVPAAPPFTSPTVPSPPAGPMGGVPASALFATGAERGGDRDAEPGADPSVEVFESLRAAAARVDLAPGAPDLTAFPRAAWLRAERTVLAAATPADLGYGDPRGTPALRRAVAAWLARNRGIRADPDQVLVVAGVAQFLTLLGQLLPRHGIHQVAVEDPGSLGARQQLRAWELATPPVPVDDDGIRVDELAATGAPAVLLTPAHQFPMGVVLGGERRRALMRWAGERPERLVIEDDYDAEHRYDRPPVPALRSMLPERVCYGGSVSKLLAPALRIGWVLAPPPYAEELLAAKRLADLGNAALPQLVLAHLMDSGALERHLRVLRRRHLRRRDAMIAAIRAHLPEATVHGAAAGLHLTITFDAAPLREVPDTDLAAAALAHGVKTHPLSWHAQRPHSPGLVLGYAATPPSDIAEGITRIARAVGHRSGGLRALGHRGGGT